MTEEIRAIEFFSGIGGLHYGLKRVPQIQAQVVGAFDMNENANLCYKLNIGIEPSNRSIESLDAATLDRLLANTWLLSPPCQPYTQGGKRLDDQDPRAQPLIHLIQLLKHVKRVPDYIFLENVPNFELSKSRLKLVEALDDLGYHISEFVVSPIQFGIPNDRKRYYLTAWKRSASSIENSGIKYLDRAHINHMESQKTSQVPPISTILENLDDDTQFRVPEHYITKRHNFRFDVIEPTSQKSSTITKAYGTKHVIGSGPMLQTRNFGQSIDYTKPDTLLTLGLRFLTPTEVARLHCFPEIAFPPSLTIKQQWKLLGNSLNVKVVGDLMSSNLFVQKNKTT